MIHTLFEDDGAFVASVPEPVGVAAPPDSALGAPAPTPAPPAPAPPAPPRAPLPPATLVTDDRQSGTKSVKLSSGPLYAHRLSHSPTIRERPAWGEFRFLRFAFRKKGAGRICLQLNHRQTQDRPARYDAGQGQPCFPQTRRVQDGALPDQWTVITRDLFADFGPLDVEGITLSAPDGQYVLFDQIYLARTVDDFRFLPQRPATDPAAEEANRTALAAVKERVVPSTVVIDFGDGRIGTGTIISGDGDILTAGHLTIAPNRNAKVTLADGRTVDAQTKGVCRDLDLGLVKITAPGPFPAVEIESFTQLNAEDFYCAVMRSPKADAGASPAVSMAKVRRLVGQQLWTDFDPPDWTAGGGLLNRYGKLVGVHAQRSGFGGAVYSQLTNASEFRRPLEKRRSLGPLAAGQFARDGSGADDFARRPQDPCAGRRLAGRGGRLAARRHRRSDRRQADPGAGRPLASRRRKGPRRRHQRRIPPRRQRRHGERRLVAADAVVRLQAKSVGCERHGRAAGGVRNRRRAPAAHSSRPQFLALTTH